MTIDDLNIWLEKEKAKIDLARKELDLRIKEAEQKIKKT